MKFLIQRSISTRKMGKESRTRKPSACNTKWSDGARRRLPETVPTSHVWWHFHKNNNGNLHGHLQSGLNKASWNLLRSVDLSTHLREKQKQGRTRGSRLNIQKNQERGWTYLEFICSLACLWEKQVTWMSTMTSCRELQVAQRKGIYALGVMDNY